MTFIIGKAHFTYAMSRMNLIVSNNWGLSKKNRLRVSELELDSYLELRNIAFSLTPELLGLKLQNGSNKVYGIIADFTKGPHISTVVAFLNGHASIYSSSGKGVIGSKLHKSIHGAVNELIATGSSLSDKARKIEHTELPEKGFVSFYFLSDKGLTKISKCISDLENGPSDYTKLYSKLQALTKVIKLHPLYPSSIFQET